MPKVCVCVKCFCRFKYAGKTEEVGVMHTKAEKGGKIWRIVTTTDHAHVPMTVRDMENVVLA